MIYLYLKHKKKKKAEAAKAEAAKTQTPILTSDEKKSEPQDIAAIRPESQHSVSESAKPAKPAKPEETPEEKRRRRIYRWKLVLCLLLPAFLSAVDTTIVATALTTIASHFSIMTLL
jgi:hypothetical protein